MKLILTFLISLFFHPSMSMELPEEELCIIGGGIAGAYSTYLLRDQNPLLITQEDEFGGKCTSAIVNKCAVDQGAVEVPPYYTRTREAVQKFGLTLIPAPDPRLPDGSSPVSKALETYGWYKCIKDFTKYTYHSWYYRKLTTNPAAVDNYPAIQVSIGSYLSQNSMEAVTPLFDIVMRIYGYGTLNEIPMFHAFSIVPATQIAYSLLQTLPLAKSWLPISINLIEEGYQGLVQKFVQESYARTLTNHRVVSIDLRGMNNVKQAVITFDNGKMLRSKKVILCAPPTHISILYPDKEKQMMIDELSQSLITSPYSTFVFETEIPLPYDLIVDTASKAPGSPTAFEPIMIGRKFSDKTLYIGYSYGEEKNSESIKAAFDRYVQRHFKDNHVIVHSFKAFDSYYPHPTFEAITNGYYSKMKQLQGYRELYFAGSYLTFEIVERTMENVEELVKSKFKKNTLSSQE